MPDDSDRLPARRDSSATPVPAQPQPNTRRLPQSKPVQAARWVGGGVSAIFLVIAAVMAIAAGNLILLAVLGALGLVLAIAGNNFTEFAVTLPGGGGVVVKQPPMQELGELDSTLAAAQRVVDGDQTIAAETRRAITELVSDGQRSIDKVRGVNTIVTHSNGGDQTMIRTFPSEQTQTYTNQVLEIVTPDGQIFRHQTLPNGFEVTNWPEEFTPVQRAGERGRPVPASDRWMQEPDPKGRFTINWYALPPDAPAYVRRALIAQHHFVVGPDAHQLMTEAVDR